ncbi:zonular occludens toxin domain-containing protein [Cupriavidus sp. RAF20_2]|uniref:zonular occludens toxin domain-containing protein n=1 Tax=Cupriavidus sp. RAF20_2 TaxID=3233053 RepID=UPI003F916B86
MTSVVTLVTGLQGNGKTLYTIDAVKALAEKEGRPVYYHGITELMLPWMVLENPEDWPDVPTGSIVVLDEAQKAYRTRANGAAVPRHVAELETLRHRGISLWLITQHPMLIDNNARRLCGRHLHLVRKFGAQASVVHEWNAVRENCDKPAGRKDSQRKTFNYPKSVFGLYKSAEVHTVKRKIPPKVLAIVPLLLAATAFLGYVGYRKVYMPMHGEAELTQAAGSQVRPGAIAYGTEGDRRARPLTTAEYIQSYTPRLPGMDYTAPAYDELTKPKRVPVPAACVTYRGGCRCYTQQGTRLPVGPDQCGQIVEAGFFMAFDPDGERGQQQPVKPVAVDPTPAPRPEPVAAPAPSPVVVVAPETWRRRPPSAMDLEVFDEPEPVKRLVRR